MPRKKRPLDIELFGKWLATLDRYQEVLSYLEREGLCSMKELKDQFATRHAESGLYRIISRLETAKLVKVRSDGTWNYVELTERGKEYLKESIEIEVEQ